MIENDKLAEIARMTDGVYRSMETGDFEKYVIEGGEVTINTLKDGVFFKEVGTVAFGNFEPPLYKKVPEEAVEDPQSYLDDLLVHIVDGKHITTKERLGIDYATEVVEIE